jgi:hypothetical protein
MRKSKTKQGAERRAAKANLLPTPKSDANDFIPGPVTLWRWRHDEASGFPTPKTIKAGSTSRWRPCPLGLTSSQRLSEPAIGPT